MCYGIAVFLPRFLGTTLLLTAVVAGAAIACGNDATPSSSSADAGDAAVVPLCVDGKPSAPYPPGPYEYDILQTLPPDATFASPEGDVALKDYYEPCAPRSRILVVRTSAAWCGPCLWQAAHTNRFMEDARLAGRLVLVDLLVADEENMPATPPALARWKEKIDTPNTRLAIDPQNVFERSQLPNAPLPGYVFIDTRTMQIVSTLTDPDPETLAARLSIKLADLDGLPRPSLPTPTLVDSLFTENEMDLVRGMKLASSTPPPDPTNEYGDDPAAAAFGKILFSDKTLSPSNTVSCATCHDPAKSFTDGVDESTGVAKGDRNSPSVALAAHSRWQFWDGRADTLWMQALGPFEDDKEFAGSRLFVAKQIAASYASQYAAIFGAKYPLPDLSALPANGKPGQPAYDALSDTDKANATRIFVNVAKAIAAFERSLRVKPNALDRYIDGDLAALTAEQKHGLSLFLKNGCVQCHWGPRLTDDAFHVLRFPTGRQDAAADEGRESGLVRLAASDFRASSIWSDAPSLAKPFSIDAPTMLGAFKTPTLRGIPTTAPYGHSGTLATLMDVAKHYSTRGLTHGDPKATGTTEQWVPNFDMNVVHDLPPFLEVLTADVESP